MNHRHASIVAFTAVALFMLGPGPGTAGPATDQLRPTIDRVVRILDDPALKGPAMVSQRRTALRRVMGDVIDFPEAAMRALGPHWRVRSAAEREEFVGLFRDLVTYSYVLRIEPYAGQRVAFTGESIEYGTATVRTKIVAPQGRADVPIAYRMHERGTRWLVYDVAVEGVSMVANYRTQFNTVIQTSSYAELVRKVKARVTELAASPPVAAPPHARP